MGVDRLIDVTADQRKTILALIKRHLPNTTTWAYGSRVKWTSRPQSDLDLVVFAKPDQERRVSELREAFEESNLPFRVDLLVWRSIPEQYRKQIEADHVVLVEKEEQAVPGDWVQTSLADLINIRHGFAFKGSYINEEESGDILLTPGNFAIGGGFKDDKFKYYHGSYPEEFILDSGDLLVTMTDLSKQADTLGYPAVVPTCPEDRRYLHNQRLGKVVIKDERSLNAGYLYYVMCSAEYRHEILASATGTTVKHTSPERIKRFRFYLPPLSEQRAIAHVLGTLDDKIELNRRMNETLEAMARALFKSWFIDFDPVRAKMAGRDPGLPQHLADIFPDRLVNSELGPIPEGWAVGTLERFISLNPESWSKENTPREIEYVDLANTKKGVINSTQCFLKREAPSRAKRILRTGDTIVGTVRPGNGSYAMIGKDGLTGSTGFAVLRPKHITCREFVYLAATSPENVERLTHLADGAAYPAIRPDAVSSTEGVVPDDAILDCFSKVAAPVFDKIVMQTEESLAFAAMRDALLPKFISGEIRVAN